MAEVDGRAADRDATQLTSVASTDREPNRWAVLALLSVAQLMVVLDATIVTIAIPSAQEALHFSTESRQWIVTAYALAFGSLLLLGGKLGDLFGRKWTLIAGLVGFSIASAIGGLAQSFGVLVAARTLQGAFGALLAPSALGLLTVTFAGSPDRPKAFGIFGAIAGGGASLGLILGGALTQVLSWRWCLYVNLVIAVPTTIVALRLLVNHRAPERDPIDIPGVLTSALGLFALVYGFSNAETHSWTATATIVALVASPVLLTAFVLIERRAKHPLLPLHIIWDRARGGAYTTLALAGAGIFAVFLFLTYFLQQQLGLSPLTTGLAFLPLTGVLVVTSTTVQTRVIQHTGVKPLVLAGMTLGAIAMFLFTRLTPGSSYASQCPSRSARPRRRDGLHLRAGVLDRDSGRGGKRGRGRLGDGQHLPAGRRLGRHLPAEHDLRQRRRQLHGRSPPHPRPGQRRGSSRLHHGVLVVGRNLRPRLPSGAGDPARPGQASRAHRQGCARPSRDRQLPPLRGRRMAPGLGLALRRVLRGDEHRPLGVCRECVGDAAEESAADGAPAALAADNQSGVDLLGDLIDRLGHRLVGLRDSCGRVVAALAGTRGALLGDLSRGSRFLLVDLAFVRYGDDERAGSGQLHRCRRPHNQYHGIGGLDQLDCGSQRRP